MAVYIEHCVKEPLSPLIRYTKRMFVNEIKTVFCLS